MLMLALGAAAMSEAGSIVIEQLTGEHFVRTLKSDPIARIDTYHDRIRETVMSFEQVERAERLDSDDLSRLVAPWTGSSSVMDELPLPVVVEVSLKNNVDRMDVIAQISHRLNKMDDLIEIESYHEWVDQLMQFTRMLRLLAILLAGLMIASLVALVVIVARTSLKLHFKTVQLLHNVGAYDDYIVRQFVVNGVWLTLRGAVPGAGVAAAIYTVIGYFSDVLASPILPHIQIMPLHVAVFFFLPLLAVVVTYVAVQVTIQSMIESMH